MVLHKRKLSGDSSSNKEVISKCPHLIIKQEDSLIIKKENFDNYLLTNNDSSVPSENIHGKESNSEQENDAESSQDQPHDESEQFYNSELEDNALREFDVLDEFDQNDDDDDDDENDDQDDYNQSDFDSDVPDDEIEAMLEEGESFYM